MIKHPAKNDSQRGFTIIELMIATAVLSTILLLVTVLMVNIGKLYYKGINQARVQDNVRSIADEVSQHLELGDGLNTASNGAEHAYCMGNTRYTYVIGVQIGQPAPGSPTGSLPFDHVLWRDKNPTPGSCSISTPNAVNLQSQTPSSDPNGTELIAPNSRLTDFTITGASPYAVSVGVAYGDNDLLNGSGVSTTCNGNIGDQFCSTAYLQTTVVRRLP